MKLENKVAIVTGGGKGIGAEISLRLAQEGAKIVIAEMDVESGKNIQKKIKENKGEAIVIDTNVADEISVNKMADETINKFSKIDILINNAGIRHINNTFDVVLLQNLRDKVWNNIFYKHTNINLEMRTPGRTSNATAPAYFGSCLRPVDLTRDTRCRSRIRR